MLNRWVGVNNKDRPVKGGLLAAAAPYLKAGRGAAAPRLKLELSHIVDTTSSSLEWHEIGLSRVSHGRYNLSNDMIIWLTAGKVPEKPLNKKSNRSFLIVVCLLGIMLAFTWFSLTAQGALDKLDAVGYAVCHRIASHSFVVNGRPLPLCARCTGMYLGALVGLLIQFSCGKRRGGFSRIWLIVFGVLGSLFVIDGLNSFLGVLMDKAPLYPPQNWLRLFTGWNVGLLIAALVYPIFTQTVWQNWSVEAVLDGKSYALILIASSLLLMAGILSGIAGILYPLAIISVLGVVVTLTLIYVVVLLMLFKQENRYNYFTEIVPVLIGGLVIAIVQIGLLDMARYLLTETWSGLSL